LIDPSAQRRAKSHLAQEAGGRQPDGRSALLYGTARGHAVRDKSLPLVKRLTAEVLDGFDAREAEAIFRFLNTVVVRYGQGDAHE